MDTMSESALEQYFETNRNMRNYVHGLFIGCCSTHVDYPELLQVKPVSWVHGKEIKESIEIVMSDYEYENTKVVSIPKKVFMEGNEAYEKHLATISRCGFDDCANHQKEIREVKRMVLEYPEVAEQVLKTIKDRKPKPKNDLSEV